MLSALPLTTTPMPAQHHLTFILLLFGCLTAWSVAATNLQLQRSSVDNELRFHYHWQQQGQPVEFSFQLPKQSMQQHLRAYRRYSPALANTYMRQALQRARAQQTTSGFEIRLPSSGFPLPLTVEGTDTSEARALQHALTQQMLEARQRYLSSIYHTEQRLQPGRQVIMVDHPRIVQESLQDLLPVASALQQKFPYTTSRELSQFLLDWLQRIPYQRQDDRSQSSGSGYLPPLQVIQQHRGDCDSKVVLMAALLRLLLPDLELAIVYLPEHAVLAIAMSATPEDQQVQLQGRRFVLADPTGPALLSVGQVAARYQLYLQPGTVNYRLL